MNATFFLCSMAFLCNMGQCNMDNKKRYVTWTCKLFLYQILKLSVLNKKINLNDLFFCYEHGQ